MCSCPDTDIDPHNVYKLTTIFVCVYNAFVEVAPSVTNTSCITQPVTLKFVD